mmetsp:Transcript_21971/g.52789  ORF Transcript_21971/g.52789 Transcript_21971/m.52789 type:complete len:292 (+) Transcript_21971:164-1039(+)
MTNVMLCFSSALRWPKSSTIGASTSGPSRCGGQSVRTPTVSAAGVPLISSGTGSSLARLPTWYVTARPITFARSSNPPGTGMPSTSKGRRAARMPGLAAEPSCSGRRVWMPSATPTSCASILILTVTSSSGPSAPSNPERGAWVPEASNLVSSCEPRETRSTSTVKCAELGFFSSVTAAQSQRYLVLGRSVRFRSLMRRVTGTARKMVPRSIVDSERHTCAYTTSARIETYCVSPDSTSNTSTSRVRCGSVGVNLTLMLSVCPESRCPFVGVICIDSPTTSPVSTSRSETV